MSCFVDAGTVSPEEGMALEKRAFLSRNTVLTLYTRDRPTVSLGRFSDEGKCVNGEYASSHGIAVIRRMSGGSAIYSDGGQIVFSLSTDRDRFASKDDSYACICGALVGTLAALGIRAEYKPVNDVLVNGMKISGCSQYMNRARLLHHGSLILKLDSDSMDLALIPLKERKYPSLTSVESALGHVPKREEIAEAFREGFRDLIS